MTRRASQTLSFERTWVIGEPIAGGGFGMVYEACSEDILGAAKFIPKDPGAERELLFADDLGAARNVVPVIDSGETETHWVLIMPRAERSLRAELELRSSERLASSSELEQGVSVLTDIVTALADLQDRVVHRDLKPENVLLLAGHWCLSDFGISRYVEATTSPDTRKFALTYAYAAPERWRFERATASSDIYSLGIVAFEIFSGERPFLGTTEDALREQHLHGTPPTLTGVPPLLAALVGECLLKAPEARPTASQLLARLERVQAPPASSGLERLQEANRSAVNRRTTLESEQSQARSAAERRRDLFGAAELSHQGLVAQLAEALEAAAPAGDVPRGAVPAWSLRLGDASLSVSRPKQTASDSWRWTPPAFEVIAFSQLNLRMSSKLGYEGRSHSLWFCDAVTAGQFGWFETAFMHMPLLARSSSIDPFALDPGEPAAKAVGAGMNEFQVAWPFTPLILGELDDFIGRWAEWLAAASEGRLSHPSSMPERQPEGSWRRS
jgi:serine/threonine-protein kinase